MKDEEAVEILQAEGHFVAAPDEYTGRVRVWVPGSDEGIDVELGRELQGLAEGSLSLDEIQMRRDEEAAVRGR
jgi:hypothetical protein